MRSFFTSINLILKGCNAEYKLNRSPYGGHLSISIQIQERFNGIDYALSICNSYNIVLFLRV